MTQQYHEEDTRAERLGPSEPPADERRVEPAHRASSGGATFYGWLVALGLVGLLTVVVGAAAAAVDYAVTFNWNDAKGSAGTIGIASGAILLVILAIGYYNGGYVAGRLARLHGGRHGFGVWLLGVVVAAIAAVLAGAAGSQYNVLNRMGLPIADRTLTTGGLVAAGAAVLVTLIAAVLGGMAGQRRVNKE
ncbi:hypothetical protein [Kribbella sp.]|uniref:hypothetical protein n=1 Tax=Kribbella sp. TaxID=1871183 RepID=UPI002D45DD86|nr:hypothetical protein [Kribbella sp.]HZX02636.1 hypothetical protein [Kribbella sp.]